MLKKKYNCVIKVLLVLIIMTSNVFGHSGRTDSNGGHYNRSTGEYHYHHGYSAHQHPNGICPHEDKNKVQEKVDSATSLNIVNDKVNSDAKNISKSKKNNEILIVLVYGALIGLPLCLELNKNKKK